ncbi:histidine phosphatase family protein [Rhodobacteraceae bacterium 63075]|nr:histidine phosphatase family protein [Rhodobacteraceae bacterium 63075]
MQLPPVYILRHGQTEWNTLGRMQGHLDSPLTELGRENARAQGRLIKELAAQHPGLHFFASPQGRVRQTRRIALEGLGAEMREDARLKEAAAGAWQGLTEAEIAARYPELYARHETRLSLGLGAPGGEGFHDLAARCDAFLSELTGPSVIFTHGVTLAVLRGLALGLGEQEVLGLDHRQGVIYAIEDGRERVLEPAGQ